uniref:Uncharacterized protein n=1 Tax=Rhizophora mucronata TaxID=61149 RepID=A0A2P2IT96_RHIMU
MSKPSNFVNNGEKSSKVYQPSVTSKGLLFLSVRPYGKNQII